jgi:hypothetical protein
MRESKSGLGIRDSVSKRARVGSGFGIREQEWARDSVSESNSWLGIRYQREQEWARDSVSKSKSGLGIRYQRARVGSGFGIREQDWARDSVSQSKSGLGIWHQRARMGSGIGITESKNLLGIQYQKSNNSGSGFGIKEMARVGSGFGIRSRD